MEILFTISQSGEITQKSMVRKFFADHLPGTYFLSSISAKKRSSQANRYFHGPMLDAVLTGLRAAGFDEVHTKADAKLVVKALFLKRDIVNKDTGEILTTIKDTSALNKDEFNTFIADIQKWSAEFLGVVIPDPDEQLQIF